MICFSHCSSSIQGFSKTFLGLVLSGVYIGWIHEKTLNYQSCSHWAASQYSVISIFYFLFLLRWLPELKEILSYLKDKESNKQKVKREIRSPTGMAVCPEKVTVSGFFVFGVCYLVTFTEIFIFYRMHCTVRIKKNHIHGYI